MKLIAVDLGSTNIKTAVYNESLMLCGSSSTPVVYNRQGNRVEFDAEQYALDLLAMLEKHVAEGIKRAFPCIKVGQAVLGLEVPHAHIHLVPMQSEKDMLFTNPKLKLTPEEFKEIAEKITNEIA